MKLEQIKIIKITPISRDIVRPENLASKYTLNIEPEKIMNFPPTRARESEFVSCNYQLNVRLKEEY